MLVNRKSIEISLFISLEMELNIHEKEFTISQFPNLSARKKGKKKERIVCLHTMVCF